MNVNKYYGSYYYVEFSSVRFAKIIRLCIKIAIGSVDHTQQLSARLSGFKVFKIQFSIPKKYRTRRFIEKLDVETSFRILR
jgi:hypothetical protein